MTNNPNLDQARAWADLKRYSWSEGSKAAAEVILSLPDEWIDADNLREVIEEARLLIRDGEPGMILNDLNGLLPAPQPRTMSDTEWDDNVHPYMEAVTISGRRHILLAPMGNTSVSENTILVAEHDGGVPVLVPAEALSPTGRYARLSLPDEEGGPEPAAAAHAERNQK